jgi:hypothetical protein
MAEIHSGTNGPINFKTYYNGIAKDPDSGPSVKIYYEDATSGVSLTANNTDVDAGSYFVYLPITATTDYKYFYIHIIYTISGTEFYDKKHYVVTRPYATVADIVDYSGYGVDTVDTNYKTYDEIMSAERYARFKINAFTGQKFDYGQKTVSALGDGVDVLLLPERIESISKVYENDVLVYDSASTNNQVSLKVTDTNYAIAIDKGAGLEVFESYPYQADRPNAGYFNSGSKYTIEGMFGYKNVPIEIYDCTIRLANDFFHQDTTWKEKYVKSMQTGDWSVDISPAAFTGTGNSAVDRMLEPFVANRMVVI